MKVSIITACRCCAPYLRACIGSVQSQKYDDYEHLIIDDRSTDSSYKILRRFAKKDKHIKLFKSDKRLRCGSSYSFLTKHITGDIVGVLDSDDALAKNAIRNLVKLYSRNPDVMYIWTQHWMCDENLRKVRKGISCHPRKHSLLSAGQKGKHCFSHWRTFRRELLDKGQPLFKEGLKSAVDKYMAYMLEELGIGGFADHPMYYYRQRLGGLSHTGRRNWERMKRKIAIRRKEEGIVPYPIMKLDCKGLK